MWKKVFLKRKQFLQTRRASVLSGSSSPLFRFLLDVDPRMRSSYKVSGRDKIIACLRFLKVRKESYIKITDIQFAHIHVFNIHFTGEVCHYRSIYIVLFLFQVCEAYFGTRNFWTAVNKYLNDILLYAMKPGEDCDDYYQVLKDFSFDTPIKAEYFSKTFKQPSRGCLRYYDDDDEFRGLVLNPFKVPPRCKYLNNYLLVKNSSFCSTEASRSSDSYFLQNPHIRQQEVWIRKAFIKLLISFGYFYFDLCWKNDLSVLTFYYKTKVQNPYRMRK